ncbi:two-component system histidine kinase [Amycolatopsis mediterranei S699]|uniref:histidine kinase n=2 Tax=Amycolatopsis mediterranei TaxID=33910 RepID=A0A0H3DC20_AMYMU|nr:histidine kinase [Amycolatopsis mediterranei]ADJ48236.1 two-component system histidine kinase [Amycolatopsis mediterranei U32]AEK45145.1 two-component system histidine kinase [Amycolatopsis mediterranei S699]AFO79947.1 two-component system histidine kinase [Amycolatopsis mediterranei S699]AGT87075.1 two-component system histidine kinase [Amycolatopsis mediterranei RB]KDU87184.1 histidine kinase [Amycolatopsis mediterranei]
MSDAGPSWPVSEHGLVSGWPGAERLRAWARAHPAATDVLLACALLPLALTIEHRGVAPAARPLLFGTGVLLVSTLAFRRRYPLSTLAAACTFALVQGSFGPTFPPTVIAVLVAVYTVGSYSRRRPALTALAVLGVFIAAVVFPNDEFAESLARFVFTAAMVVAAFVLGVNVRMRRVYLASLRDRALRAERDRDQQAQIAAARERAIIAREMHDIVAHNLSVMIALADGAAYAARTDAGAAETTSLHVSATGRQALDEMHRLLGVLRNNNGDETPRTPQPGVAQIDDLVTQVRTAGLPTSWTIAGERFPLSPTAGLALYRVAQEALTNVLKHAVRPSGAHIRLTYTHPAVTLEIDDDGASSATGPAAGHGLSGMRERVAVFGGDVTAGPRPGGGWRVTARLEPGRVPGDTGTAVSA